MARAVFRDADVYLLDDPLSAVDAHVGSHLFEKCIKEALDGKTRILVTHHVNVLPQCDHVIILEEGKVKVSGSYDEIMKTGIDVSHYIPKVEPVEDDIKYNEDGEMIVPKDTDRNRSLSDRHADRRRSTSGANNDEDELEDGEALIQEEEKMEGSVQLHTYISLIRRGGTGMFLIVVLAQLSAQLMNILANFWLVDWGEKTADAEDRNEEVSKDTNMFYLHGFAAFMMTSVALMLISRVTLVAHRTEMSKVFHSLLLDKVLYTTVGFFDITPIGRYVD